MYIFENLDYIPTDVQEALTALAADTPMGETMLEVVDHLKGREAPHLFRIMRRATSAFDLASKASLKRDAHGYKMTGVAMCQLLADMAGFSASFYQPLAEVLVSNNHGHLSESKKQAQIVKDWVLVEADKRV